MSFSTTSNSDLDEDRAVPTTGGEHMPEPELDNLGNIIRTFNDQFGNVKWKDADRIRQMIAEKIPWKLREIMLIRTQ